MPLALPDKQFFKIGEVAEIVGVKTHVLRYWESEFSLVRPLKTRGAHRMYKRVDVELLCRIRHLLHEECYTITGAKRQLRKARELGGSPVNDAAQRELVLRSELIQVRNELKALLEDLSPRSAEAPAEPVMTATITAVVPKTALLQRRGRTPRSR